MAIDDDSVTPGELPAINETPAWDDHLPAVITGVKVRGGDDGLGAANFQARALDRRTRYLKQLIEQLTGSGIILKGELTQEQLDAIPTAGLQVGTAYFVEYNLRAWNGTEWASSGSLRGARGINVLGSWPDTTPLPERTENEIGDAYLWRNDIWVLVPEPGSWESLDIRGPDGKSSFDLWKEIPGNENKTIAEFWEDQRGPAGPSTYDVWVKQPGNEGKTEAQFLEAMKIKGDKGDPRGPFHVVGSVANPSELPRPGNEEEAYVHGIDMYVWVATLNDYLLIPGISGKSAFDIWKDNGHPDGTLEQFLESMTGYGLVMLGQLQTEEELLAIDTTNLLVGSSYFVDYALRTWTGTEWKSSGSLRGARGINLLGNWPAGIPLPEITENEVGDAYLWRNDIWILSNNPVEWEALGIRGADGKTAFEVWKEVPGNENKTLDDFWEFNKGPTGDSTFEAWKKIPGNEEKTWAQFLAEQRGPEGPGRAPFHIAGTLVDENALPRPGDPEKAYYIGIDMYVWVTETSDYAVIPGINGKDAFQVYKDQPGNADKTLAEFWEFLRGPKGDSIKGDPGDDGADGRNFRIISTVPNREYLDTLQDPQDQDAYATADTGRLWIYLPAEGGWKDLGPWRGVDGKSAYQLWQEDGHEGQPISAFWTFLKGQDGKTINLAGAVATYADLPLAPADQDVYAVRDESAFYAWVDAGWLFLGTFGKDGAPGVDGKNLDIIKILTEEDQTPPVADATTLGKAYIDLDKFVWVNIQNSWQNAGKFKGDTGEIGPMGTPLKPRGTVPSIGNLPNLADVDEGDMWFTADTKLAYVKVDGQWSDGIDMTGNEGKQGVPGTPGALMPIKGVYQTMTALRAAHPTGALGDAYMIIDQNALPDPIRNLAIWSVEGNDWVDTGPAGIKGEKGDTGEGIQGRPGDKGDKGSQWLTLDGTDQPSNTFNGRSGDWAVTRGMKVWYKTADQGWILWGQLVAGDVNSPLSSLGLVVRHGTEWVALPVGEVVTPEPDLFYARRLKEGSNPTVTEWVPVEFPIDEVTAAQAGSFYARRLKSGSTTETEWVAIVFPQGIIDLAAANDKQYVRVWRVGQPAPEWRELAMPAGSVVDLANPVAGKLYLRRPFDQSWVEFTQAASDGKVYVQKDGSWIAFDRYDLLIKPISATYAINPNTEQFVKLDNSGSTAKTISLNAGPSTTRAMVVILEVVGVAGVVSFGGTNIKWDNNTIPSMTGTKTLITFTWDGEIWIGAKGPALTT